MSELVKNYWQSEGKFFPPSTGWSICRRNKTSGKSRSGIIAINLKEYVAKTIVNDANRGSRCFKYKVVSPTGEVLRLERSETK